AQLGRRDHLHGLGDLPRVSHAADASPNVEKVRHRIASLLPQLPQFSLLPWFFLCALCMRFDFGFAFDFQLPNSAGQTEIKNHKFLCRLCSSALKVLLLLTVTCGL